MKSARFFLIPILLSFFLSTVCAQQSAPKDDVHWCSTIPVQDFWHESRFSAIFRFEIDSNGKPINIQSIRSHLIKDEQPFLACISSWHLPNDAGKVTATIDWEWSCKSIEISALGIHKTFPCQPPRTNPQHSSR